jgi:hypothetical protein
MKILVFSFVLLCTLVFGSVSWESKASNATGKQRATVQFSNPVVLHGVTLKGEYLFVHDDAAMQRGEDCTYVYEGRGEALNRLVISFHCIPVARAKADRFMVRSVTTPAGSTEVREFQFAGDTEAHGVPAAFTVR